MINDTQSRSRKLIKLGDSVAVTLPPEFIRRNHLKAGDKVGVTFDRTLVVVVPPNRQGED